MRPFLQYLKYCFKSKYRHGYGIHSPYVYHLVTTIIEEDLPYYKYSLVESVRKKMLQVGERIGLINEDGTKTLHSVKSLVKKHSISAKYGQLLFRLVNYYQPTSIVEYGATCGLSAMYMSAPNSKTPVFALTRQNEMADLAKSYEDRIDIRNVKHFATQDQQVSYSALLDKLPRRDFLFVHEAKPEELLEIVRKRIEKDPDQFFIVLPNTYTSKAMRQVWATLKSTPRVKVSIDIFEHALLIADTDLQKGDYVLRY